MGNRRKQKINWFCFPTYMNQMIIALQTVQKLIMVLIIDKTY